MTHDPLSGPRKSAQTSINAFSRVLAVMLLMLLPGVVGFYLDRYFGTRFLIVIGFILGMGLAIFGLIQVARQADEEMRHRGK